jgi:hypothetical protein
MGYKKIALIAVFLIVPVLFFTSTYCEARPLKQIKDAACPGGKVKMQKIVTPTSKFIWKNPNKTVLLFPDQKNFPKPPLKAIMDPEALKYAQESLRLIPPIARTNNFIKLYEEAIETVKENHGSSTVTTPMVAYAFSIFKDCCLPLDMMGKTEIPGTYPELHALITDPDKFEEPPAADLLPAQN